MNRLFRQLISFPLRRVNTRLRLQQLEERLAPATFMVTSLADTGPNTLRQAVLDANANGTGIDSIGFNIPAGGTITLASQLVISGSMTINGPASKNITVSGNDSTRLFDCHAAVAATNFWIYNLNLIDGNATGSGGAILAGDEQLLLVNCTFNSNAASVNGGAIDFNEATFGGLTLIDCTFSNNSAGADGGAVAFDNGATTIDITRSTFSNNASVNAGGALHLFGVSAGTINVRNSTFFQNVAKDGGAIRAQAFGAKLAIQNTTIVGNTATGGGGGIATNTGSGSIKVESSIISGNVDTTAAAESDVTNAAVAFSFANSAIGSSTGLKSPQDLGGNLLYGTNLKLGALTANGGSIQSMLPAGDSPLIDAGSNPGALTNDQRGHQRTIGLKTDIGAVEVTGLTVLNTNDAGPGSLRQTVQHANSLAGADTITFNAAAFATPATITLTTGQISITDASTITGPGAKLTTVNGNSASRVFNVDANGAGIAIGLSGLTITGGKTDSGGGILVKDDALTLSDCAIVGNTATSSDGGGVYVQSGGSLVVHGCELSANKAQYGGAIDFFNQGGTMLLENSILSGNSAGNNGGAIYFKGTVRPSGLTIRNSTFANNSSGINGGAIMLAGAFTETLVIQNSTFVGNYAGNVGGAIRQGNSGTIAIESSVIAGNGAKVDPDVSSTGLVTSKTSAIGSAAGFTSTDLGGNIAYGTDLKLGTLSNNGGLGQTILPLTGSPLIDAGSNPASLTTDQRGSDHPRSLGAAVDIGAAEFRPDLVVTNTADTGVGSLRAAVDNANAITGPDLIVFDPVVFNKAQTITLSTQLPTVTGGVTISCPVANRVTLSGNGAQRIMRVLNAGTNWVTLNNLTMTDGNAGPVNGGALLIENSSVALNSVVLSNNKAGNGGAILLVNANLSITDSNLTGNTASNAGGAIRVLSAVTGNTITIDRSTLSFNVASTASGGALVLSNNPVVTVRNSTISGNTSGLNGGAVRLYGGFTGTFNLFNSTVANNVLANSLGIGRGISRANGTVNIVSSIVAQNSGGSSTTSDVNGVANVDFSLIGTANFAIITGGNNQLGTNAAPVDAKLAPLADRGGPTATHALLAGSPALNKGSNPETLTVDQRGIGRSVGVIDIGAFELQPPTTVDKLVIGDGNQQRSTVTSLKIEFSTLVSFIGAPESAITLTHNGDNKTVNLSAAVTNAGSHTNVTLQFTGGAVDGKSLADGTYTLKVRADELIVDSFDGNKDGVVGDNYVFVGTQANGLFRLFGDSNGDGTVNGTDFLAFRLAFLGTSATFDFDGNGHVNGADFLQFRLRFLQSV